MDSIMAGAEENGRFIRQSRTAFSGKRFLRSIPIPGRCLCCFGMGQERKAGGSRGLMDESKSAGLKWGIEA